MRVGNALLKSLKGRIFSLQGAARTHRAGPEMPETVASPGLYINSGMPWESGTFSYKSQESRPPRQDAPQRRMRRDWHAALAALAGRAAAPHAAGVLGGVLRAFAAQVILVRGNRTG